jgi:hypothetical protein
MPLPYILPQVQVFQEFTEISPEITNPLRAWIVGPNGNLFRYADSDEKALIGLGQYNPDAAQSSVFPHKSAGSVIDTTYVKLWLDGAKLEYFADLVGADSVIAAVPGYPSRVRSASRNFATRSAVYPRDVALLDRDVAPGDLVFIRGSASGSQDTLWTYVKSVLSDMTAAAIAVPVADVANQTAQAANVTIHQTAGPFNQVELLADVTSYNALIDGHIDDTYTIKVVSGSVGADYTTALLLITTVSGYEYLSNVVPGTEDITFSVGVRGLRIGFDDNGSSVGISPGIVRDSLQPGQTWTLRIRQSYVLPTTGRAGLYVGKTDDTYVVTVTSGGLFGAADVTKRPRVTIRTVSGTDSVVNVVVNAATAFALGTSGANMQFNTGAGLVKGDRFYIAVTAAAAGAASTLVLGNSLSTILQNATDLDLRLYIPRTGLSVPAYVTNPVPGFNWTTDGSTFTVNPNLYAFDPTWTLGGVQQPLSVAGGAMFLEYREWLPTLVNDIDGINDISQIDSIPGPLDPDNPLKWAVSKAVANCGGTAVRYTAVADPTELNAWIHALGLGSDRSDVYSLVPLSYDQNVLDLFVAHVNTESSETSNRWRKVFINLQAADLTCIVQDTLSTNGQAVQATITDDPNTSGTQLTLVAIASNNASLLVMGVQAGDLLRTNYAVDPTGATTYDEFVIATVYNEDTLLLVSGPLAPITVAQKIRIYHPNSKTELSTQIGLSAGHYGNRRVCAVWPDTVGSAGVTYPGYHLCAALAGLAGGVVPQQHLTNIEVAGFNDLTRTTTLFDRTQLDNMASYGVWIVTQNNDGNILTRDALTTDRTSLQSETEMVVRNIDSMSFVFYNSMVKYIGRANVVQTTLDLIRIDLVGAIEFLKTNGFVARLGGQLIDGDIITLRQSVIQLDHVVCAINLTIPYPLNVIELHLVA